MLGGRNSKCKDPNKNILDVITGASGAALERVRKSKMAGSDSKGGDRCVRWLAHAELIGQEHYVELCPKAMASHWRIESQGVK